MQTMETNVLRADPFMYQRKRIQTIRRHLAWYMRRGDIPAKSFDNVESILTRLFSKLKDDELENAIRADKQVWEEVMKLGEIAGYGPRERLSRIRPAHERPGGRLSDDEKLILAELQHTDGWTNGELNRETGVSMRILSLIRGEHVRCHLCCQIFKLAPKGSARRYYKVCSNCGHDNNPIGEDWPDRPSQVQLYHEQIDELRKKIAKRESLPSPRIACYKCHFEFEPRNENWVCPSCGCEVNAMCNAETNAEHISARGTEHEGPHRCADSPGHEDEGNEIHGCRYCDYIWKTEK